MAFPPRERPKSLIFRNPMSISTTTSSSTTTSAPSNNSNSNSNSNNSGNNSSNNTTAGEDPAAYSQYANPLSPARNPAQRAPPQAQATDARNSLQRRFTTNALPSLAPIGEQRRQPQENGDKNGNPAYNRMSKTEKVMRQYEALLDQQRRIQAQMAMIDPETRREVDEAQRLEQDINLFTAGVLSEPATPPDHQATHAQQPIANFNRFSTSSITSPVGGFSNLTSPPADFANPYFPTQPPPSQSVPNSQRNSDHEESEDDRTLAYSPAFRPKAGANPNRNSMPVTAFDLRNQHNNAVNSFSPVVGPSSGSFFFGGGGDDEEHKRSKRSSQVLQLHQTDDQFPILVRRGTDNNALYSGSVTPLTDEPASQRTDRSVAARHRQSLPPNVARNSHILNNDNLSGLDSILADATAKNTAANRRSLEVRANGFTDTKRPGLLVSPHKNNLHGLPKVSSSYSTNDIPTLKSIGAMSQDGNNGGPGQGPAEEEIISGPRMNVNFSKPLTNNDATIAYDPAGDAGLRAIAAQHGINLPPPAQSQRDAVGGASSNHTAHQQHLQYTRPSPSVPGSSSNNNNNNNNNSYSMDALTNGFGNLSFGLSAHPPPPSQWQQPSPYHGGVAGYPAYGPATAPRYSDRMPPPRRQAPQTDDIARLMNAPLEILQGEIYGLCKDQHGCRFLQKKLEERRPENTRIIFEETITHVVELMTDPFGNYLCQKLLEWCNDEQRTALIRAASPSMMRIALNQHGTRALQKMIEFISTQEQINMVIAALGDEVVSLIQDLNGNHVIQKCLNHLKREDCQFIVDAVSYHVITVGTHRHGCCVLQRCVDHASGMQKAQLVAAITKNVFHLVQDPFGNYVVQYILDLGDPLFSEPLCQRMIGSVSALARQKFSSNVMEKGIRVAEDDTRRHLVEELLQPVELQRMLRDSFANYVVQTGMDYADDDQKSALYDLIRPMLPSIRHTPHGRRIQTKIQDYDNRNGNERRLSGRITPTGLHPAAQPGPSGHGSETYHRQPYNPPAYGMAGPGSGQGLNGAGFGTMPPNAPSNGYGSYTHLSQNRFPGYPPPSHMGRNGGHHDMNRF